jgi:hypothetical protein
MCKTVSLLHSAEQTALATIVEAFVHDQTGLTPKERGRQLQGSRNGGPTGYQQSAAAPERQLSSPWTI